MQFYRHCPPCNNLFLGIQGVEHHCNVCPTRPLTVETTWTPNKGRILYEVTGTYAARLIVNDDLTYTLTANNISLDLPATSLNYLAPISATTPIGAPGGGGSWFTSGIGNYAGGSVGQRQSVNPLNSVSLLLGQQTAAHAGYGLVHVMYNHPNMLGAGLNRSIDNLLTFTRNMTKDPSIRTSADKIIKIVQQDNGKYAVHGASAGRRAFCVVTNDYGGVQSINTFYMGDSFTGLSHFRTKLREW